MSTEANLVEPKLDEVRLFMFYTLFGGDAKRTAVVANVELHQVEALAHDFNWKAKLSGRNALDTEQGQEAERALNRATNYVVAERLRRVYSRIIDELDSDPTYARQFCTAVDEDGKTSFNTKNLVDLSKGLQIVTDVSYRALQDKQAQQADVSDGSQSAAQFSLTVYKALASRFDHNAAVDTATEITRAVHDATLSQDNSDAGAAK